MRPRNRLLSLAALACALLGALLVWRGGAKALGRPEPALPEVEAAEPPRAAARLEPSAPGAAREVDHVQPSAVAVQPSPTAIRGMVTFRDGVPADGVPLVLRIGGDSGNTRGFATSSLGTFELADLEAGGRHVLFANAAGLFGVLGEITAEEEPRTWVLPGLRVRVQVECEGRKPPRAWVSAVLRPGPGEAVLARRNVATDEDGLAEAYFEETGFAEIEAVDFDRLLAGRLDGIPVVPSVSRETQRVVLRPLDEGASLDLRVVCRGCVAPSPFLCILRDPKSGLEVKRLQTEDVGADGLVHGLPEGVFELELGHRIRLPGSLHQGERGSTITPVKLSPGAVAQARFEVDCGARLRLFVSGASAAEPPQGTFSAWLVPDAAPPNPSARPQSILWRSGEEPEEWTSTLRAPFGVSVAIEDALAPGFYALTVRADGWEEWRDTVVLEPCLETEREILLHPAEERK